MAPGSKLEPDEFVSFLLDQLRAWAPVTARRMFSGYGLFRGEVMFAMVSDGRLYLRTDSQNRPAFEVAALPPFRYARAGRLVALGYHEAPPELLEDGDRLIEWVSAGYAAALRKKVSERPRRPRARRRR